MVDGEGGRVGMLQNMGSWIMSARLAVAEAAVRFKVR